MIRFDREITVYVTANTEAIQAFWVNAFADLFQGVTRIQGYGVWQGIHEHVVLVSHLYDSKSPDWSHYELNNLLHNYKREANQEAVLVVEREVKGKLD